MQKIVLHIDMNSYFASVEQQANPLLRGKPLGVCAYLSQNGCIIASSKEAKKYGVTTGMRVFDAKTKCPNIILVENEPAKYRSTTEKIFSILSSYTDRLEPYSIDEAFLDLTGWHKDFLSAKKVSDEIRKRIYQEVGEWLSCSIGISYTRWLAKFASDIAEKNSTFILSNNILNDTLKKHKLTMAWGINYRLARRLNWLGIFTLYDLKQYPVSNLMSIFGKPGYYFWANVNGIELLGTKAHYEIQPKSFGHSYCIPKKTTDRHYLSSILMKLCERTGHRLREKKLEAKNIGTFISFVGGGGAGGEQKTKTPLFDTLGIYTHASRMVFSSPLPDRVSTIAVRVSNLIPLQKQLSFFEDAAKIKNIALAMDAINDKYGEFIIYPGQMMNMEKYALDRVGYRKTVEVVEKRDDITFLNE